MSLEIGKDPAMVASINQLGEKVADLLSYHNANVSANVLGMFYIATLKACGMPLEDAHSTLDFLWENNSDAVKLLKVKLT